jgi:hypothetical protein
LFFGWFSLTGIERMASPIEKSRIASVIEKAVQFQLSTRSGGVHTTANEDHPNGGIFSVNPIFTIA